MYIQIDTHAHSCDMLLQAGSFYDTDFHAIFQRTINMQTRADHVRGNDVKTVVFVREPYARLLSAYVDKLFQPKVDNWKK